MNRILIRTTVLALSLAGGTATAQTVQVPHTFEAGTPARAEEVNQNFDAGAVAINDNAMDIAALMERLDALEVQDIAVDCDQADSIQAAVDRANRPTTIFIVGICVEDVTITKDDITLSGNISGSESGPGGSGTISGTVDIKGADRIVIEFLTITGSGEGANVTNGSSALLESNLINNNAQCGVSVTNESFLTLLRNTISNNGRPGPFFESGVFVASSTVNSRGNTITGNGYGAIEVDNQAFWKNGLFVARNQGVLPDPADLDIFVQDGCAQGAAPGSCGAPGSIGIEVFNGGNVLLRNADVTGFIDVATGSNFEARVSKVSGNIDNNGNSVVRVANFPTTTPPSLTDFRGTLFCSNGAVANFSAVQCGQTCSGDIATTCF